MTQEEIEKELALFEQNFPKKIIPYEKKEKKDLKPKSDDKMKKNHKGSSNGFKENKNVLRDIFLKEIDIEHTFAIINSKEMAKFVGLFAHLSYWLVFGHVNPIELDSVSKKQIFVQLYEVLMEFSANTKVRILI